MINVSMTDKERAEFEAFKAEKARQEAAERGKRMREDYTKMVDEEIALAIPELISLSEGIGAAKKTVMDNFKTILDMKAEIFRSQKNKEMDFDSHQFTASDGSARIVLGRYMNDGYLDTAEEGIGMIREYLQSLATDDKSASLVGMVLKLLSKDAKGNLKAQRVIQLRKLAEKSGDERFIEGVKVIEEAYNPTESKTYIRAYIRDPKTNGWQPIPLGMTES